MKVGLVLQDNRIKTVEKDKWFYKTLKNANKNNLDILVFPEHFYCPSDLKLDELSFLQYEGYECHDEEIIKIIRNYAIEANCPIVVSRCDADGFIYGLFVSPFDDSVKWYGKHIATTVSSFQLGDYEECISDIFKPIEYKGFKIGLTICYDSNQPIFSKAYGEVDLLINLTGGHVDYKKWSIYQKTRALENRCNYLCTMAYVEKNRKNKSYVFGYDGNGKELPHELIGKKGNSKDIANGLYVFEINNKRKSFKKFNKNNCDIDEFIDCQSSVSKNITVEFSTNEILNFLSTKNKVKENLFVVGIDEYNLVIIDMLNDEIENPLKVSKLLYDENLKKYENKRYLILNRWTDLNINYYERRLSTILKCRAAESFSIVMLISNVKNECIQVGLNKNTQIISCINNKYGLDFKRATGPESFWKNNNVVGVKKAWRESYEMLINKIDNL